MSDFPDDQLLTAVEAGQLARISRATIYKLVARGEFPAPLKVGAKCSRWKRSEVMRWIAGLEAAKT